MQPLIYIYIFYLHPFKCVARTEGHVPVFRILLHDTTNVDEVTRSWLRGSCFVYWARLMHFQQVITDWWLLWRVYFGGVASPPKHAPVFRHLPTIQVQPVFSPIVGRVSHSFCLRHWENAAQGCFSASAFSLLYPKVCHACIATLHTQKVSGSQPAEFLVLYASSSDCQSLELRQHPLFIHFHHKFWGRHNQLEWLYQMTLI